MSNVSRVVSFETSLADGSRVYTLPLMGDNYAYLVAREDRAFVVDPSEARPVLEVAAEKGLRLTHVLNTHHHIDHVSGNLEIKRATRCRVVGPDDARIPGLDLGLNDGDGVPIDYLRLRAILTPGHTRTSMSYFAPEAGALWCGDTLFNGGCGRLVEGHAAELWDSLRRIRDLPDDTLLFCGHEYTRENLLFAAEIEPHNAALRKRLQHVAGETEPARARAPFSLAEECAVNPFLRVGHSALKKALGMEHADEVTCFAELRRRKDEFS